MVVWLHSQQTGQADEGQDSITHGCHLGGPKVFEGAQKNQTRKNSFLQDGHEQRREPAGRVKRSINQERAHQEDQKSPVTGEQDHPGAYFSDTQQVFAQETGCQEKNQGPHGHEADYDHNQLNMLSDHFWGFHQK
jgi:hypothetical protein